MKKFNPNKNIIITLLIVILVVTVISITAAKRANDGKTNFVQAIMNDTVAVVDKVVSAPGHLIKNGTASISHLLNTYSENERLKEKLDDYDAMTQKNNNNEKEIAALKEELSLNQTLTSYEKVTANVVTRSPDSWQDTLVVDRGTTDGVEVNMAVMSNNGLIGRVIEVNLSSSKVELLTSGNENSNHFPIKVSSKEGDAFGLLRNYDEKTKTLIVTQLTGNTEIKEGDVVQTSGLGGNSPADLQIGTVIKIEPDSFGLDRQVYVKPYAEMYDISVVTIIKRLAGEG
ncbi:rod shape-determining protein MreC [Enterococcus sp. JM4C]|uniref:rod shape-determining protein MreC n=1 Tax=Candidatus Enterococcus huntleyi TaxID=1857217 RepID=UPI00137A2754|nr:rod shape-determining protein MreC [Enterococcus sp. JM4C]KAF1295248.1 rod shape-determining protein MreC [Enterococcus sp. JM4C]